MCTIQVNSAFRAFWLASSEAGITEQTEKNKMASRFASANEEQILSINEAAVRKNTKLDGKNLVKPWLMVSCQIYPNSNLKA